MAAQNPAPTRDIDDEVVGRNVEGELPATSSYLFAASFFIGDKCGKANDDFLVCKSKDNNPAACLEQGKVVTECAVNVLKELSGACDPFLMQQAHCLDMNNYELRKCRRVEFLLADCAYNKLNYRRSKFQQPEKRWRQIGDHYEGMKSYWYGVTGGTTSQ